MLSGASNKCPTDAVNDDNDDDNGRSYEDFTAVDNHQLLSMKKCIYVGGNCVEK